MENVWSKMESKKIPSSLIFDEEILKKMPQNATILDLGCGNGALCNKLNKFGFNVYGIDCSEDAIRTAKEFFPNINFYIMDAESLKFEENFFDLIILNAVLTVVPTDQARRKIMVECNRVLKNNGYIYLADFAQTWHNPVYYKRYIDNSMITGEIGLFNVYDNNNHFLYTAKHFNQKEIVDLYLECGFDCFSFNIDKVTTRSGNTIDGYKIILTKKKV